MGAKAKSGVGVDRKTEKSVAEKKRSGITAEEFDHQVAAKMGAFFEKTFLPGIKKLAKMALLHQRCSFNRRHKTTGNDRTRQNRCKPRD
jgi:hypothetical protein